MGMPVENGHLIFFINPNTMDVIAAYDQEGNQVSADKPNEANGDIVKYIQFQEEIAAFLKDILTPPGLVPVDQHGVAGVVGDGKKDACKKKIDPTVKPVVDDPLAEIKGMIALVEDIVKMAVAIFDKAMEEKKVAGKDEGDEVKELKPKSAPWNPGVKDPDEETVKIDEAGYDQWGNKQESEVEEFEQALLPLDNSEEPENAADSNEADPKLPVPAIPVSEEKAAQVDEGTTPKAAETPQEELAAPKEGLAKGASEYVGTPGQAGQVAKGAAQDGSRETAVSVNDIQGAACFMIGTDDGAGESDLIGTGGVGVAVDLRSGDGLTPKVEAGKTIPGKGVVSDIISVAGGKGEKDGKTGILLGGEKTSGKNPLDLKMGNTEDTLAENPALIAEHTAQKGGPAMGAVYYAHDSGVNQPSDGRDSIGHVSGKGREEGNNPQRQGEEPEPFIVEVEEEIEDNDEDLA